MLGLQERAEAFVQSWPRPLRREFQAARRCSLHGRPDPEGAATPAPFWVTLPRDLAAAYRNEGGRAGSTFLPDVLWGQFCLFAFIRLQDDLYDRQAAGQALLFGADQFAIEAGRAFARQMAGTPQFWSYLRGCLERTTRAIVHVDTLQRAPGGPPRALLAGYAQVGAVFKVGLAAVCLRYRRLGHLLALGELADAFAVADQILDDLEDVQQDLERGRFNYAAKVAIRALPAAVPRAHRAWPQLARQLSRGDTLDRVLGAACRYLQRASDVARSSGSVPAEAHATAARRAVDGIRAELHFRRVQRMSGRH